MHYLDSYFPVFSLGPMLQAARKFPPEALQSYGRRGGFGGAFGISLYKYVIPKL